MSVFGLTELGLTEAPVEAVAPEPPPLDEEVRAPVALDESSAPQEEPPEEPPAAPFPDASTNVQLPAALRRRSRKRAAARPTAPGPAQGGAKAQEPLKQTQGMRGVGPQAEEVKAADSLEQVSAWRRVADQPR